MQRTAENLVGCGARIVMKDDVFNRTATEIGALMTPGRGDATGES